MLESQRGAVVLTENNVNATAPFRFFTVIYHGVSRSIRLILNENIINIIYTFQFQLFHLFFYYQFSNRLKIILNSVLFPILINFYTEL